MKKVLPLLLLTLFLGACAPNTEVVFQPPVFPEDGIKHTLIYNGRFMGDHYKGIITEGTKEKGSGVFVLENEAGWYEGEFVGEKLHGQGTITYADGTKYVGEYKDGKQHGQGTFTFSDGGKYEGEWKDGQYNGQGTITYADGTKYVGEFKDGKPRGQGTYTFADGRKYVGEWKDGKRHGQGTSIFADGEKYEGEYKDGKPSGQGTITFTTGANYIGEFKDGKENGQGTYTFADGRKYVGEWKDGKRHGQGTYTFADGETWTGEWLNDKRHTGQGTIKYEDGSKYVGEFKDGKENGQGTYTFADGRKYVGEWKDGKYYGKGVAYKVNGEIQSGTWVNNTFQQPWTVEAVSNFLENKYPQFTGFDYVAPTPVVTAVKSSGASIYGFIAVLEFEGNNISSAEVRALTDRLRSELVGSSGITIIERGKMEEVLKEQAFQQTGCVSSECAVEVGKLLSVEHIIIGSISRVGSINSVTARVVSVESGEIIKSAVYDHSGDIGGLLTQGMRKVAEELGK